MYITGPNGKLVPLSTFATLETSTGPRDLKRFQQLNAVRIQGVIPPGVPLEKALKFLEDEARKIMPRGYTFDYAGESRQLRIEGSRFLGTFLLSAILIYLVLAAQFESFRDPFIILAGSVPLALSGALLFSFLGFTSINIYSQVGLITLVGLVSKQRHPHRRVREPPAGDREGQAGRRDRSRGHAPAPDSHDHGRDGGRASAARICGGPGAGARNSIGIMLVTGMIIGTAFTLFVVPSIYMLVARTHRKDEAEAEEVGELEPAPV